MHGSGFSTRDRQNQLPLNDARHVLRRGDAQRLRAENGGGDDEGDVEGVLHMAGKERGHRAVEVDGVGEQFVAGPEPVTVFVHVFLLLVTPARRTDGELVRDVQDLRAEERVEQARRPADAVVERRAGRLHQKAVKLFDRLAEEVVVGE